MDKQKALERIAREISECRECRKDKSGLPVPGEGNPDAKIMFVGEAAGPTESRTGRPFVGRSGKFLTGLINSIGLDRKDVFITSPVKYYPGKRTLRQGEIEHGAAHLKEQIKAIDPRLLVLLGNTAIRAVLGKKLNIRKVHGSLADCEGRKCFMTFHPAAALRSQNITRKEMEADFTGLKRILKSEGLDV